MKVDEDERNDPPAQVVGVVMTEKTVLLPGPRHPITVEPARVRVLVRVGGQVVADSTSALTLREADYPAVHYIPREDVDLSLLVPTRHTSYCPFKGEASYFDIPSAGEAGINAVWSYERPYDAVTEIAGHLAFYPNRAASLEEFPL